MSDLADEMIDGLSGFLESVKTDPDGWSEDPDLPIREMAKKGPFSALIERAHDGGRCWYLYRDGVGMVGHGDAATYGDARAAIDDAMGDMP